MLKILLNFLHFLVLIFFRASYRNVLPTLIKRCYTEFESNPLFTKYLVYSFDLSVKLLSLLQIERNL